MCRMSLWNAAASRLQRIRQPRMDYERMLHTRRELERLLSVGDYLIHDIGLDPREVREWLETESREAPFESHRIPCFPGVAGVRPA